MSVRSDPPRTAAWAALALGAVTVVWGSTFVLAQSLIATMPVSSFMFWRFAIATVALAAVRPRAITRIAPPDRRRGVAIGLVVGVGFALQTLGLRYTSASVSGFVTGMFVVLTPVMSGLLFRERISASVRWGVALAVAGLAVLSLHGSSVGVGEAVTLVAAVAFAAQIAMLGQWATSHNAYGITLVQIGVVALVGAGLTVLDGGPSLPSSVAAWAGLVFLGLVASALAFTVQAWSQSHLSATRSAVIMTSEPLWAGVVAVVVAGEPTSVRLVVGGALVLLAMYVVELGPRRASRPGTRRAPEGIPEHHVVPLEGWRSTGQLSARPASRGAVRPRPSRRPSSTAGTPPRITASTA